MTREEIKAGAQELRAKLERLRPRALAYTGIGVYRWFRATSKVGWGVQESPAVPGATDVRRAPHLAGITYEVLEAAYPRVGLPVVLEQLRMAREAWHRTGMRIAR